MKCTIKFNKRLPGWIAHLVKFCISSAINLKRSCPTILSQEDFFHISRASTPTRSHLTTLIIISVTERIWLNLHVTVLEIKYVKNYCLTFCSIFSNGSHAFWWIKNPYFNSMQDTQRNIHTKFGSNWSSCVRGKEFWKLLTRMMDNDDYGC